MEKKFTLEILENGAIKVNRTGIKNTELIGLLTIVIHDMVKEMSGKRKKVKSKL